jgi:hypothetical protein
MCAGWRWVSNVRSAELVRAAQPIARCGEVGGVGRGCEVAQRGMRALAVVVVSPSRDLGAGVIKAEKQGFVEQFVEHPTIEAFAEAVLHRLSRRDKVPRDLVFFRPGQHGVAGELGAVVGDDHAGPNASCCAFGSAMADAGHERDAARCGGDLGLAYARII